MILNVSEKKVSIVRNADIFGGRSFTRSGTHCWLLVTVAATHSLTHTVPGTTVCVVAKMRICENEKMRKQN